MARAHGDGAVYEYRTPAGKVRYRGAVVVAWKTTPTGRQVPVRKYVSADSKAECARKVRAVIKQRDAGRTAWDTSPTVQGWLTYWLDDIAAPALKANTVASYRPCVTRMIDHVGPRLKLDQLTGAHFDGLYAAMTKAGRSPTTIRLQHRVIHRALAVAVRRDRLHINPLDRVDLPPARAYNAHALPVADAARILATATGRGESARWLLALLLGLRQGEALGLTWDLVDLDAALATVTYATVRVAGRGIILERTKSDKERPLHLPPVLVGALRERRAAQLRQRARSRTWGWVTDVDGERRPVDLVFTTGRGTPVSREDDWRAWRDLLAAAGVAGCRVHDARVATATYMGMAGVHPRVAMEVLGHGDLATTAHYTKVPSASAAAAIDAVADLLARAVPGR